MAKDWKSDTLVHKEIWPDKLLRAEKFKEIFRNIFLKLWQKKKQVKKDSAIVGVANNLDGTLIYYNNKILQGDILYTIWKEQRVLRLHVPLQRYCCFI